MVKISVIIPVYNVEEYIFDCINSIINQSIKDIEVIVVDDGSTDNSINIVKSFNDSRIKIITKKNGGLSSARNVGIDAANGEYIYFTDSDDFIGINTALENMYSIGVKNNSDIIVGNAIRYHSENKQYIVRRDKNIFELDSMERDEFLIKFRKSHCMYAAVWMNMYKKKLILDNGLRFKEGFLHEDEDFTPRIFLCAKKISIYPENFYMYRIRKGSIMESKNIKKAQDIIDICIGLQEELDKIKNLELKKYMSEYEAQLVLKTSYDNKTLKVDKKMKKFVLKNTYNRNLKLHALLYNISPNTYYKFLDYKNKKVNLIM